MPWSVTAISLVILLLFPLGGRKRGVHACLFLAAVAWIVALSVTILSADFLLSLFDFGQPAMHDTYYVVGHVHAQLVQAGILAALAIGAWLARPLHRVAMVSFWVGHIAMVATTAAPSIFAPTTPDQFATLNTLSGAFAIMAGLAFLNLGAIVIFHLAARARKPR